MTIVDSSIPEGTTLELETARIPKGAAAALLVGRRGSRGVGHRRRLDRQLCLHPCHALAPAHAESREVASVSALLLIAGTVAGAALPWVLAQEVVRSGTDRARRRSAVSFCVVATVLYQGGGAGLAACLITVHSTDGAILAATFCSVLFIFMAATAVGYLQGLHRAFRLIAVLKVSEATVKIGAGVGLVALGAGAGASPGLPWVPGWWPGWG